MRRARAPSSTELTVLAGLIAHRVCRHLVRQGWLEGEGESAFLSGGAASDDGMAALRTSSITYRGAGKGRLVFLFLDIGVFEGQLDTMFRSSFRDFSLPSDKYVHD